MSNPIIQIKRGTVTTDSRSPGYFNFNSPLLLPGELCDIEVDGVHKLFLGNNSSTPILLNPEYVNTMTGTNEISGYKIYLGLNEEAYGGGLLSNTVKSSYTITIPPAGEDAAVGLITNGNQIIAGDKTFIGSILPENTAAAIGAANKKWTNIYATNFMGNASTASRFESKVKINNTEFDGSYEITTDVWGTERNIAISGTASADAVKGTNINGSTGYTLYIPDTMTGFTSITTTTLLPTNSTDSALGSATQIWTNLYVKNPRIYNSGGNHYIQLQTDLTSTDSNYVLTLPAAAGELVYHSTGNAIGGAAAPVYIAASGAATECTTIDIAHGGTGVATIASNGIMIGKGTNAVATIAPVAKGSILVSNGTNAAPKYAAPSLTWSAGDTTTAPTVSFNLNSQSTSVTIPFASSSATGLVNTTTQTFAGAKTFSGAMTASSTLTATGKITANGGAEIKNNLIATSIVSSTSTTKSSITLSNSAISMLSTKISLDGKIILTNDSYGTSFPSNPEEGQIFFLIS